ncbi:hypothetical protein JCM11641_001187, partial [Rhodosporidiobolus odoratus]
MTIDAAVPVVERRRDPPHKPNTALKFLATVGGPKVLFDAAHQCLTTRGIIISRNQFFTTGGWDGKPPNLYFSVPAISFLDYFRPDSPTYTGDFTFPWSAFIDKDKNPVAAGSFEVAFGLTPYLPRAGAYSLRLSSFQKDQQTVGAALVHGFLAPARQAGASGSITKYRYHPATGSKRWELGVAYVVVDNWSFVTYALTKAVALPSSFRLEGVTYSIAPHPLPFTLEFNFDPWDRSSNDPPVAISTPLANELKLELENKIGGLESALKGLLQLVSAERNVFAASTAASSHRARIREAKKEARLATILSGMFPEAGSAVATPGQQRSRAAIEAMSTDAAEELEELEAEAPKIEQNLRAAQKKHFEVLPQVAKALENTGAVDEREAQLMLEEAPRIEEVTEDSLIESEVPCLSSAFSLCTSPSRHTLDTPARPSSPYPQAELIILVSHSLPNPPIPPTLTSPAVSQQTALIKPQELQDNPEARTPAEAPPPSGYNP